LSGNRWARWSGVPVVGLTASTRCFHCLWRARTRAEHLTWASTLIYGEQHLRRILSEYSRHYNAHRSHQSREQKPPLHEPGQAVDVTARIKRTRVVQGLISEYRRAA
jgi:hypothetical protein